MNTDLCFGQRIDPEFGILEPWYVNDCVDRIKEMDLSDKVVMEWGGGGSTIWWAMKAKYVYSVDHNLEWYHKTKTLLESNGLIGKCTIGCFNTHEGDQSFTAYAYINAINTSEYLKPNICIVDGIHRYECAENAVKNLKPDILIIDNHQQDYVFMCPKLDELLEGVRMERFIQPDHTDHSGNPWATAIFYLNEKA